jgi:hypothetical protein
MYMKKIALLCFLMALVLVGCGNEQNVKATKDTPAEQLSSLQITEQSAARQPRTISIDDPTLANSFYQTITKQPNIDTTELCPQVRRTSYSLIFFVNQQKVHEVKVDRSGCGKISWADQQRQPEESFWQLFATILQKGKTN